MRYGCRVSRRCAIRVLLGASLALLLPAAAALPLDRVPRLQLIDSDPGQHAILRHGEPLYLRIRYRSAIPIHILISGYHRGDVVRGFRQDSGELFPAGNRAVTVWLAYPGDARIDQVNVRALNANKARVAVADFPIRAEWTDAIGPAEAAERTAASWVAEVTPAQRERMVEMLSGTSQGNGFYPLILLFLCVPAYFLLQAALTLRASGGWRKATLVPAVLMGPILVLTVLAFLAQSNLWPLLLLLTAPLACLYLVVLSVILVLGRIWKAA